MKIRQATGGDAAICAAIAAAAYADMYRLWGRHQHPCWLIMRRI